LLFKVAERKTQVETLQLQIGKLEEDLALAQIRVDEESAERSKALKRQRDLEAQLNETIEDLEAEKVARMKAEKMKKDLNEELEKLRNELLDSLDSTGINKKILL
jgi:myosin protein heavy chain